MSSRLFPALKAIGQERLNKLTSFKINYKIALILDYSEIIATFSNKKAPKVHVVIKCYDWINISCL